MLKHTLLVIGHTFPEPTTTAAGSRMLQLMDVFTAAGYTIHFATTAAVSERSADLDELDVSVKSIALNSPSFDVFIIELNPDLVLFDRFITEEQFGWRVTEHCPNALRILDTEDLHFLRKARQEAVKMNKAVTEANLYSDTAKRELASILRCDLSLIISEVEMELLQEQFVIPKSLLYYLPFLVDPIEKLEMERLDNFENREHFMTLGNFLHAPNVDAVLYLKKEIWPRIREKLPAATLFVYGAYAPQQILELHNEAEGFIIGGWIEDRSSVMEAARICLAPIRFGAGLKGKILDAMLAGTPVVTTSIGAEGMTGKLPFSGWIANDPQAIASAAVSGYTDSETWSTAQQYGFDIVANRFQRSFFSEALLAKITSLRGNLVKHRKDNFIGQILQHQTLQASRYMSKWIQVKNSNQ